MIPLQQLVRSILANANNMANKRAYHRLLMDLVHNGVIPKDREIIVTNIASRLEAGDITTAMAWTQQLSQLSQEQYLRSH